MLVSAIITVPLPVTLCNNGSHCNSILRTNSLKLRLHSTQDIFTDRRNLPLPNASSSSSIANTYFPQTSNPSPNPNFDVLRHVTHTTQSDESEQTLLPSASAVASAIQKASTSPVEFSQRVDDDKKSSIVLPSHDFQRLCVEQLDLFRRIVPEAVLTVYVRPAGSYVMDRLELRRVTVYPQANAGDITILVGHFNIPTGLRATEAALSNSPVKVIPERNAVVFPMVKHPFVVGFLVAELPLVELETCKKVQSDEQDNFPSVEEAYSLPPKPWEIQTVQGKDEPIRMYNFTDEQRLHALNISRSLAMAYVMDQKALLLQQSTWQNNVRMSNLVEQIRSPLSSIQTLSKILTSQTKRSEISYDIVEDILVQGDQIRDVLQQLQDAVFFTKANIMRYNEGAVKKMNGSSHILTESVGSQLFDLDDIPMDGSASKMHKSSRSLSLSAAAKDLEMPLPPLALAPLQHGIRPCNVSDVLADLVNAVKPLALKQKRVVELSELSSPLIAAVEEPALRQAFSNLIEGALLRTHVGGKVEIVSMDAPAGGALVIIDDDGPDMHYMTQMHSLTPYRPELLSEDMVEDNMTWNFVAGLTVAREILESYGCVVRVISPRTSDAPLGAGGSRIELWLPSSVAKSDMSNYAQEA